MWFVRTVHFSRPRVLVILASMVISVACGRSGPTASSQAQRSDPRQHATRPAARLAALLMDHAAVRTRVGDHRFRARHKVSVTVDKQPDQAFEDRYKLRCTRKGACYGRHDNSLEYGVEFYRIGDTTYFRQRYQRFLRFLEEPEEAGRRIQHIWGAGAAVVDLLRPNLKITKVAEADVAGRPAVRYRLALGSTRRPREKGRRAWRTRIQPLGITGEALLDKATGVPLKLEVRYAVRAPKDGRTVEITGYYTGTILKPGQPVTIRPPADFVKARPRDRETLQLRMLGNHRLNPGWFRGGGPREGWRRARKAASMGPSAPMGASSARRRARPKPPRKRARVPPRRGRTGAKP